MNQTTGSLAIILATLASTNACERPSDEERELHRAKEELARAQAQASAEVDGAQRAADEKVAEARRALAEEEHEALTAFRAYVSYVDRRLSSLDKNLDAARTRAAQTAGAARGDADALLKSFDTRRAQLDAAVRVLKASEGVDFSPLQRKIDDDLRRLERDVANYIEPPARPPRT